MKKLKEILKSPYMILVILLVKLLTYYQLIGVTIFSNVAVLGSIAFLAVLFAAFSRSDFRFKKSIFLLIYTFFSIIMFADTMYYNYYNQTVSVKQLWQVSNVAKVPSSFIATLIPASFILLIDIPFIYYYFKKDMALWKEREDRKKRSKHSLYAAFAAVFVILVLAVNPTKSVAVDKVNSVEFFSSHINDIYETLYSRVYAKEVEPEEVLETVEQHVETPGQEQLRGIAKGRNVIVIQVEALQNFLIGAEYNGQELTPNLNRLLNKDTLYFDNYYSTIGKGNTVDAEFTSLNSLYPVIDAECYRLYERNTYNGLPWLLKEQGYGTFAVHGYEGEFWNRESAYPYQGIDEFYSMEDLVQDDMIGLGISDKSMFRQAVDIIKKQQEPYFSFIITLTNHHPYILDEERSEIKLQEEHEGTKFGNYLNTARYTDEAIGEFIDMLKEEGLYDNTVIALYGDHHGLNCKMDNNDVIVSEYLGRDYDYDEMLHIPLMIHIPGSGVERTISTLGGQIDFMPTMANLLDLNPEQPYVLGQDLVNAADGFAAFTAYLFEGSFASGDVMFEVSREGIFEGSRAWQIGTGRELNAADYREEYDRAIALKQASKDILDHDLIGDYVDRKAVIPDEEGNGTKEPSAEE